MKKRKIISIIMLILILLNSMQSIVSAFDINNAKIEDLGDCGYHLQFWDAKQGKWSYIITNMVGYRDSEGILHYAYCMDVTKPGVGEEESYTINVTEMLKDPKVYTAIINGFPYKSASELGVENDYDAFALTKQAVYCILYNRDVRTFYRGGDIRGQKMIDAMDRIVNIARNNPQIPSTSTELNINKIGDFQEDSKEGYYSQTYSVSGGAEVKDYTVSIGNYYDGTIITDINGNIRNVFSGEENFKILVPINSIIENKSISISVNGNVKNYPIFYGKAPSDSLQDYALTYSAYSTAKGNQKLDIDAYKSSIKVVKVDQEIKKPLKGVEFNFRYSDGQNIGNYKTNSNGEIIINKLKQGTVIATEVATLDEYILNDKEQEIILDYNTHKELIVENEHKRGDLTVYKVDADNNKIGIGGVEFALYSYEFDKITGYYKTDANGEIQIKGLRTGDWALIEKNTNKWYNLNEDPVEIKIKWNEITNSTIENELKKSQVKVIKVDKDNHEIKLENVVFEVLDENGNVLETIKTNKNGEAITSRYPIRDFRKLYLRETITNDKYVLDDKIHIIELKENEIVDYIIENQKIQGKVKVIKTAEEDNKINGDKAGMPIPNVSFGVYDENKNFIEKITTDESGIAITNKLDKGIYYVKELEGENGEWYQLNENEYSAEIVKHGEIVELNITNKPDNPEIDVEKDGIIQTTANQEIKYDFIIKNTGNVPLDNFTWYDFLPTDYVTATKLVTGTYNQDLNYAIYYKTNKNDYKLLRDNLNTQVNNYIDFTNLKLEEGEYVTEFKTEFGTVDVGFTSIESPQLFVKTKSTVKNDDTFTNKTKVDGYHKTYYVWDEDSHTTKVYEKKLEVKLPRTGC
ncbi:MAG: SpaA isopeptide-forming pilin-related protein [Clostridia bacterium]